MRTLFGRCLEAWKESVKYMGDYQARLLLTVCYFTVLAPFGVIAAFKDPLHLRTDPRTSGWVERKSEVADLERARHMF